MARVFVSHASEDLDIAVTVGDWLRGERHQVFMDHDLRDGIQVGELWKQRLYRELQAADAVLCVVTAAYVRSDWCAAEIAVADVLGSRLLPLRVEPGAVSRLLDDRQYVDYAAEWQEKVAAALRGVDAAGGLGWPEQYSPFPGLRAFDVSMALFFRGRADEVRRLAGRLRATGGERAKGGLLLVVGPSGCGKSSFVRAGLLAQIAGEPGWELVPAFLPGHDPVGALARALAATANRAGLVWTVADTRQALGKDEGLTVLIEEILVAGRGPARQRLLLVIDQGEELFTRADPGQCARLAALVGHAVRHGARVVVTLRSEYQDQFLGLEALAGTVDAFALQPLDRAMLRVVIEEPARLGGLTVDRELVERLVADTASGEALPLLAFTLNQLADGLNSGDRLSTEKYEKLGGVRGALSQQADAALASAVTVSGLTREEILSGLVRMAYVDLAGRRTRRRVAIADMSAKLRAALDAFVEQRLLTSDSDAQGRSIGVAHEALLTVWPPLSATLAERTTALHAARSVEQAADEWKEAGRAETFLWDAGRLAATEAALGRPATTPASTPAGGDDLLVELEPGGFDFLAASRRRAERERRRRRHRRSRAIAVLSTLLAIAVAGAGLAVWQRGEAIASRLNAEGQSTLESSRKFVQEAVILRDSNPRLSLALSLLAYHLAPDLPEARDSLLSAQATYYARTLLPRLGPVHAIAINPAGDLLATAQHAGKVALWQLPDHHPLPPLQMSPSPSPVFAVAFSRDGKLLAAADEDGHITLWDAHTRQIVASLTHGRVPVKSLSFSPDSRSLASGGDDGVTVWDTRTAKPVPTPALARLVNAVAYDPVDSNILAVAADTADGSGGITFWNPKSRQALGATQDTGLVQAMAFSPDGTKLATGSDTGAVTIWKTGTRRALSVNTEYSGPVLAVAFGPDGQTVATGNEDGAVRLWAVGPGEHVLRLLTCLSGPANAVVGLAFGPDGHTLVSAGTDEVVGQWNVSGPTPSPSLDLRAATSFLAGGVLATADPGHLLLWHTEPGSSDPVLQAQLARDETQTLVIAADPHGTVLAVPGKHDEVDIWDVATQKLRTRMRPGGPPARAMAFSADGKFLAVSSGHGTGDLELWDPRSGDRPRLLPTFHVGAIDVLAFRPGTRDTAETIATGGHDGIIALSGLLGEPGQVISKTTGNPLGALAFRDDGSMIASGSGDGTVRVWTLSGRRPQPAGADFVAPIGPTRPVIALSFSHDGLALAVASTDGVIRIWDVRSGSLTETLTGRPGTASVAFAPAGKSVLATVDLGGTPVLWDINAERVKQRLCAGPALLTQPEWTENVPDETYWRICP